MKKLLVLTLFLFGLTLSSKSQVPSYIPKNGLVAWYPFNGNANDESGNGNNGLVNGATLTNDRFGIQSRAYSFKGFGNKDHIKVKNSASLQFNNEMTISIWYNAVAGNGMNVNGAFSTHGTYSLFAKEGDGIGTPAGFFGDLNFVDGVHDIAFYNTNDCCDSRNKWNNISDFSTRVQNSDNWVCLTFVNTKTYFEIYVNGVKRKTVLLASDFNAANNLNLYFGIYGYGGDNEPFWYPFNGKLDDIGIWNRALTQEEIKGLNKGCTVGLTINPLSASINSNTNATFNASTLFPASLFQWQTNPLNVGWQNVPNNSTYSGATTNSLKVNNVKIANHLQQFRVVASGADCIDTSAVATITIKDTCIATNLIAVTDTLKINTIISGLAAPNNVNTIKIFPNPASDHITIDFGKFALMSGYKIRITNAAGLIVYTSSISQQTSYIDLSSWTGKGIYFVQIIDKQNITIENKKIIIQ
jgi:hypothetical protein